jgi:glycosyltransferase involved in cell wall biosynthesis
MSLDITWFRDFAEDCRQSMEVYADSLGRTFRAQFSHNYQVREYRPRLSPWLTAGVWQMRVARFGVYPWQARRQQGEINHIIDHGYSHLLYAVDPARTVVTVHDLIPLLRWRRGIPGMPPGRRPWLNQISFGALRRAAHLIAISENTRCDLISLCGCDPEKITVIYYGVDRTFRPYTLEEKSWARYQWGLSADGILRVLIVGSPFYKNQTGALRAFTLLRELCTKPLQLVKVGSPDLEWTRMVRELKLEDQTRCLGVVPHARMAEVYNSVECLLFPSWYEGFGLPPLEAMACGTSVVASNAASLPEAVGDAGLMVDPQDEEKLAQAMHAVLMNEGLRRSLIERGLVRAQQFTWERNAQQTLDVYEKVAIHCGRGMH